LRRTHGVSIYASKQGKMKFLHLNLLILCILIASCHPAKKQSEIDRNSIVKKLDSCNVACLLNKITANQNLHYFMGKGSIRYQFENERQDARLTLYAIKDSLCLISLKKLGVEAFRILLLPDRIFLIARLNQEYSNLNYIDLQKKSLKDKNTVEFVWEGDTSKIRIEPLLFIPFVENAFKYVLHNQEKSDILIGIRASEYELWFYAENVIFGSNMPSSSEDSGIGIQNVERRLALHYPDTHDLRINNNEGKFRVDLKIKLA